MEQETINGYWFCPHIDKNSCYTLEVYLPHFKEKIAYIETVPVWVPNETETGLDNSQEFAKVWMVFVKEEYRRKGIATAMYLKAEKDLMRKLIRGDVVTDDGQSFVRK